MASSGFRGPFNLTVAGVDNAVTKMSAGAYALGKRNSVGAFSIYYVGRSDDNVHGRLRSHVAKWYPEFKFEYYPSTKAAFEKECGLYHDFNPPDNEVHPARPEDTNWKCPRCNNFG